MAQWIRRLPTEQEILGSSPGRVKYFFLFLRQTFFLSSDSASVADNKSRLMKSHLLVSGLGCVKFTFRAQFGSSEFYKPCKILLASLF